MSKRRARFLLCALALAFTACALSPLPDLPSGEKDNGSPNLPSSGGTGAGTGGGQGASSGGADTGYEGGASPGGAAGAPNEALP